MECFLGKSSPRPCKSILSAGGHWDLRGGGWRASAPQCQVEKLHREAHVVAGEPSGAAFRQESSIEQKELFVLA